MAYYAPVDPLTGLPYATDVGYTGVTGVGVVDPLTGGYVVGGGLGGTAVVETTTYTTTGGVGYDPITGLPLGGGVYQTF